MNDPSRPIDLVHLSRQTGGDQALEQELLALFAEQCQRQVSMLTDAALALQHRRDAAHTLKGAARAVGAWAVADAAERVEAAFGAGEGADAPLARLSDAAGAARQSIARLVRAA